MSDDQALFDKGMPIRRAVLGPDYVDSSMAKADEFMMAFQRATTAWAWGWAWGDPTLDHKTRSMLNLARSAWCTAYPKHSAADRGGVGRCSFAVPKSNLNLGPRGANSGAGVTERSTWRQPGSSRTR